MAYRTLSHIKETEAEKYDIFNKNNTHSCEDECPWDFNCMSYAFKVFGWFLPVGTPVFDEDFGEEEQDIWEDAFCFVDFDDSNEENITDILEELGVSKTDNDYYEIGNEIYNALWDSQYDNEWVMKLAEQRMLKSFKGLRKITSFDELKDDEYGIVYACGGGDFHFVRYEDGVYSHKMGGEPICTLDSEDEGFGYRYDSRRIYFAMKNSEVGNYSY